MSDTREIQVPKQDAGQRLDVFLARELRMTRGYVRRLLGRERVRLEGRSAEKGTILRAGDRIEIAAFRHPEEGPLATPDISIPVLRAADGLLAVDKPAGLPTHPLDFEERATVLNALLARHPELLGIGEGGLRSGVVHRLDTYTSGVLLFATREAAWRDARAAFERRQVEKHYLARVHGCFVGEQELCLRLEPRGDHMRVVSEGGREAQTRLRALRAIGSETLVEAQPISGLMHQIRVSLAHLGHPVVGDRLYGSPSQRARHLLHATALRVKDFEASSPAPPEFYAE